MITIYSVQHNHAGVAHRQDIPVVDITVMTGNPAFAPTWALLKAYRAGHIDSEEYTRQFHQLMDLSEANHPEQWRTLLSYPTVALACYCRPGHFCHRHLLKARLLEHHHRSGQDAVDGGELLP
jgi:uncharacterized protein YeaO (DUF488 family)